MKSVVMYLPPSVVEPLVPMTVWQNAVLKTPAPINQVHLGVDSNGFWIRNGLPHKTSWNYLRILQEGFPRTSCSEKSSGDNWLPWPDPRFQKNKTATKAQNWHFNSRGFDENTSVGLTKHLLVTYVKSMSKDEKVKRILISLHPDFFKQLEEYRVTHHYNRSEFIRFAIRKTIGLEEHETQESI